MLENRWENTDRTTIVSVDSCENGVLAGRMYNPLLAEGVKFESLLQFLLKMEELLDAMDQPEPPEVKHQFTESAERRMDGPPGENPADGKCATFAVRVLFRQNASWQGSVTWLDEKREESFRSALELILLISSTLVKGTAPPSKQGRGRPRRSADTFNNCDPARLGTAI